MRKVVLLFVSLALIALVGFAAPTKVTVWYSQTGIYSQTLLDIIDEFNAIHEGEIVVEAVYTGSYGDTLTKLLAALVANDLPTMSQIEQSMIGQFIDGMAFESLTKYINKDPEFKAGMSDFFEAFITAQTYDGVLYGFPLNPSTPLMYANRDLFRKAGLDPDERPVTWQDVYDVSKAIHELGEDYYGLRFSTADWILEQYMWSWGGSIISEDGETMEIYSPENVKALEFLQKAIADGVWKWVASGGSELDMSGTIGLTLRSTGSLTYLQGNADWDVGAFEMPEQGGKEVPIGGANVYMFKNKSEAEKAAGWEFLKFLTSRDNTLMWAMNTGYMCSRKSAYESNEMQAELTVSPLKNVTYKQLMERAVRRPWYGPYREVLATFTKTFEKVVTDPTADCDQLLKETQAKCQDILDEYYW
ncbi:MAG TPA: ABC transporter substrate-binding protein [Thermotogota bacterium]|nr:ABC transporter substrate-binding protein [Thermotogota bacterium]